MESKQTNVRKVGRSDLVILKELHEAADSMSYYNAAEGDMWYKEKEEREKAAARLRSAIEKAREIGFELNGRGDYLI